MTLDLLRTAFLTNYASAIRYAINLHEHHDLPLTQAYASAVNQFRALRSERQVASNIALLEAESIGIQFGPSMLERTFMLEEKSFETWKRTHETDMAASTARKRWRMIMESVNTKETWSRGQDYVRLWQQGVRPTYSPALATSAVTQANAPKRQLTEQELLAEAEKDAKRRTKRADFMALRSRQEA